MTKWRRSLLVGATLAAVTTLAVPAGASTAPAAATKPRPLSYVALGDSYSSGNGAGRYDVAGEPCRRSSLSYPSLWARRHRLRAFTFRACSAATTMRVATQQALQVPRDADLVTLTAGGNDVGFSLVLRTCTIATSDSLCTTAIRLGQAAAVTAAPAGLAADLMVIKHRAPHARIVVLGYPRLFETGPCTVADVPNATRRAALNRAADLLDNSLAAAARAAGARFVDVRGRFAGHGVCAPPGRSWLNPPGSGKDSYHPTALGYARGYLPALTAATA